MRPFHTFIFSIHFIRNPLTKSFKFFNVITLISLLSFITNISYSQWREKHNGNNDNIEITGISFITPSTGFIGLTDFVGFTIDSGKTYTARYITMGNTDYNGYLVNLTFGFAVKGVLAFSADSLFAYGHYGTEPSILFSHDGGLSWKVVFHRNYNIIASVFNQGITDIQFPGNGPVGFAVHNEEILKTSNRGQTWYTVKSEPNAELKKLSFPSQSIGFVSGKDKIYRTPDGGVTWIPVQLPDSQEGVTYDNIFFTSNTSGYVLDNGYSKIYKTIDGSITWTKMNDETLDPISGNDLYFINDSTGFVATGYYTIGRTSDYGKTWETCKRDNDYHYFNYGFNALYFLNSQTGWCGGGHEYLEITTDGAKETYPKAYFKIDTIGLSTTNTVQLVNYSRKIYTYKWYKNNSLISTAYNASYTHNFSEPLDTIKLVVSNGIDADTAVQYQSFSILPTPEINSFSPTVASTGTRVEITGSNLSSVTNVYFGGTAASSFQIISDERIDAIVASGTSGDIIVSSSYASTFSKGFIYNPPPSFTAHVITGFSPSSGLIGTVVSITGSNFNSDPQKNIVLFGTAKAVITSASPSQIVCKVPSATTYQSISVLDLDTHLYSSSLKPFNVIFADSATITPSSFVRSYDINFNKYEELAHFINAADIDGDGKTDIIATLDSITAFRNTSDSNTISFQPGRDVCGTGLVNTGNFTIGDLDGDGKPDFVTSTNSSWVTITRNTSIPGFISTDKSFDVPVAGGSEGVAIGDLDGDGRQEIACADYDGYLSILRNTSSLGNISFAADTFFSVGSLYAMGVAIGDIDGDGKKDVITLNEGNETISVFRNLSTKNNIAFAQHADISASGLEFGEHNIFLVDYDGDNKLDIIQPLGILGGAYLVFRNISTPGNIAFASPVSYNVGGESNAVGNLKGFGNPDFVTNGVISTNKSTPGNISSSYTTGFQIPANAEVCADINGDGKQDIISAQSAISVFKNQVGVDIPFTMCAMGTDLIISDLEGGGGYQWQEDTGQGFNNIQDNANFQGTNTEGLSFSDIPASWDGRRYRCIVDGYKESSSYRLNIFKHFTPVITITGDSVICEGGKSTHVYVPDVSQELGYIYDFRWQVNNKPIDTAYFIIYSTDYHFKNNDTLMLLMDVDDQCGTPGVDTSKPLIIHVLQTPLKPGPITGPTQIIAGSSNEYYIDSVNNTDTYTWTDPQNASNLPQTTFEPQVDVLWNSNFQSSDYICVTAKNVCGISEASCTNSIVLPLALLSFTAEKEKTINKLEWVTATEINLSRFEIQRSNNGILFSEIGSVVAKNSPSNYYFYDNLPLTGTNYYRLKIIDKDGKFTNSEIKKISNSTSLKVDIIPNPVINDALYITIRNDENTTADIFIISADSKVLLKQKLNVVNGLISHQVNISNLAHGVYFLEIVTAKNKITKEFVKLND